jgi:hypothetical protein
MPCATCSKRRQSCVYPTKATRSVKLDLITYQNPVQDGVTILLKIPPKPNMEHGNKVLNIFLTKFVGENSFTGSSSTWFSDVQTCFASDKVVHHALKALSTLYAYRESNTDRAHNEKLALQSYQTAISSVRQVIDARDAEIRPSLLSSTFLLGLFEVMLPATPPFSQALTIHSSCTTLPEKAGSSIQCLGLLEYSSILDLRHSARA